MIRVSPGLERLLSAICILSGCAGAGLVWGVRSADRDALNQQVEKFAALDPDQQQAVRRSFADLNAQSEPRKAVIFSVFRAVQAAPELRDTLERYYSWWSGLDQTEWDAFQELNVEDRLTFARSRMNSVADPLKQIVVEFPGPVSSRLPPLHLTFEEFGRIVDQTLAAVARPPALQSELEAYSTDQLRTLRLTLWMFENVRNQRDPPEVERVQKRLRSAILKNVSDATWKARFESTADSLNGKPYERVWMFTTLFSILGKATIALGEDLRRQFPVNDEQIKEAFAALEDKELQHSLMTMTADEARSRLPFLAQKKGDPAPEEQLLVQYMDFAKERERILRFATFGFGGPGQFPPGRNGGPDGPRDGRRRPPPD